MQAGGEEITLGCAVIGRAQILGVDLDFAPLLLVMRRERFVEVEVLHAIGPIILREDTENDKTRHTDDDQKDENLQNKSDRPALFLLVIDVLDMSVLLHDMPSRPRPRLSSILYSIDSRRQDETRRAVILRT